MTERQAEPLLGEGRHPDADRIEAELLETGADPVKARRTAVLGRPIEHIKSPHIESPWLAMDLVYRAPSTAQAAWALLDDASRRVLELCQDIARDKSLARLEESVAQIRWGSGGKYCALVKDGRPPTESGWSPNTDWADSRRYAGYWRVFRRLRRRGA